MTHRTIAIFASFTLAMNAFAGDSCTPSILYQFDAPGNARDVVIQGNTAYVVWQTTSPGGMSIYDVADTENPIELGTVTTPAGVRPLDVVDNTAFVAGDTSGLQIIDISNPESPQIISSVSSPDVAFDVVVEDDIAFVPSRFAGLQVIDVSDRFNPSVLTTLATPSRANSVAVSGNYAYVTTHIDNGLEVVDVTDPENPFIAGSLDTAGLAVRLDVKDGYVYLADSEGGFLIVDVQTPSAPTVVGSLPFNRLDDVTVSGDYAFLALNAEGVAVADISNPQNPTVLASLETGSFAQGVDVIGNTMYLADGPGGLKVIDLLCLPPVGACCTGNEVLCVEATEEECIKFGHQWGGPGSSCQDLPCPQSCEGDVTNNGVVNFADLVAVLSSWGACP